MKKLKLTGYGYGLPAQKLAFGNQTRYRVREPEEFWEMAKTAAKAALERAGRCMGDIDCIVAAMATPLQGIPCNAALLHEQVARGTEIPAMDINSSCSSFLTALDVIACMLEAGRYRRVLVFSGDLASSALNPKEKESYELFSDVCTAFVAEVTEEDRGILYAKQKTWSEAAHHTEIPRGGAMSTAFRMTPENRDGYYFTMDGLQVARFTLQRLEPFLKECLGEYGLEKAKAGLVIPHQASRILSGFMKKLGFSPEQYADYVEEYGNMVSGSVPFVLCKCLETGRLQRGEQVLFLGSAAGLTVNLLLLRY